MNDFLYTFSSKQISAQLNQKNQTNNDKSVHQSAHKNQHFFKNIRTKKLRRYQKYMQPSGNRKLVTQPQNEFIGLENIASETLVKMSAFSPLEIPRSIKTIQESNRNALMKDTRATQCIKYPKKCQLPSRKDYMKINQVNNEEQSSENKRQYDRRRCLSLKDAPLVNYPSNQKKLPRAFRFKSINKDSSSQQNKLNDLKVHVFSSQTPKSIARPSLCNLTPQSVKVSKSSSKIHSSGEVQQKVEEEMVAQSPKFVNY